MPPYWPKYGEYPSQPVRKDTPEESHARLRVCVASKLDDIMRFTTESHVVLLRDRLLGLGRLLAEAMNPGGALYDATAKSELATLLGLKMSDVPDNVIPINRGSGRTSEK
jgi:hypothetical protein